MEELSEALVSETAVEARSAIAEKGAFSLCVPGGSGSTASFVAQALGTLSKEADLDFSRFHVFFDGGRLDSQEYLDVARKAWIDACGIPLNQVHAIAGEFPPEGAAAQYTALICMQDEDVISDSPTGLPAVDLLLLDTGDDGSVGRLRPNSDEIREAGSEAVVLPQEQPGEEAVALSLDFMNGARRAIVTAPSTPSDAADKRKLMVSSALSAGSGPDCPAGLVLAQRTTWLVDSAVAGDIKP